MNAVRTTSGWSLWMAALLLLPADVSGQIRMSILGGVAVSELTGEGADDPNLKPRTGVHFGVGAEIPIPIPLLGRFVAFVPGGLFMEKGFAVEGEDSSDSSAKMSYLDFVVPLKLSVPLGGTLGVYLFGGPGFALEFGCLITSKRDGVESAIDCSNDDLGFKSTDRGLLLGGGLSYNLQHGSTLLLNAALDRSLSSIDKTAFQTDIRHRTLLIGGGVTFPLGR